MIKLTNEANSFRDSKYVSKLPIKQIIISNAVKSEPDCIITDGIKCEFVSV